MGKTMVTFRGGKLGIRLRWAHKKYKKCDAKDIVRKIKKIQNKPAVKVYERLNTNSRFHFKPKREKRPLRQFIQDGDKIIQNYVGVNEQPIFSRHVLFNFSVLKGSSSHSIFS